jgi:preprotein translocase subunit SecF
MNKKTSTFKFMSMRWIAFGASALVILAGIVLFFTRGFNLGIDFTGGTMVEVSLVKGLPIEQLRSGLSKVGQGDAIIQKVEGSDQKYFIKAFQKEGQVSLEEDHEQVVNQIREALNQHVGLKQHTAEELKDELDINNASEQTLRDFFTADGLVGEDVDLSASTIIELRKNESGLITNFSQIENSPLKKRVISLLKDKGFLGDYTFLNVEIVGPQVGSDLKRKTTLAAIWALLGMLVYIGFRFKFIFGFAAVITLFHDVLIVLTYLLFFQVELSLQVIAAILTIIGYSLNDTIVIFDRVRDNLQIMKKDSAEAIIDTSINQTLSRTIMTSGTTLVAVVSLYLFGGEVINTFAATMFVGIFFGTYSSIFQSCAWLKIFEGSFLGRKKE